jgi:hypothetical protein
MGSHHSKQCRGGSEDEMEQGTHGTFSRNCSTSNFILEEISPSITTDSLSQARAKRFSRDKVEANSQMRQEIQVLYSEPDREWTGRLRAITDSRELSSCRKLRSYTRLGKEEQRNRCFSATWMESQHWRPDFAGVCEHTGSKWEGDNT